MKAAKEPYSRVSLGFSVDSNLTDVEEKLNETALRMLTWYNDAGSGFTVRGATYRSLQQSAPQGVLIEPITLRCPLGAVWYIDTCGERAARLLR